MMYPAGPGSGDSPEGFSEQPRVQPQIGNCTAQTLDAFFTCRKNALLAKSSSTQVEGDFAMAPRAPDQEECEGLLQQWREEGSSQVLLTSSEGPLVDKGLAQSSLALLMDNPGEQDAASEDKWSSRQLSDLRAAENLEEPFPEVLGEEPLPEIEGPMWAAVPMQTGPQFADCAVLPVGALAAEQWEEDPAVVAWSIAPEPVPLEEAPIWTFGDLGQLQPPPVEIPYHEILWREWEDFSTQPDAQGLEAGDGPQFQFTLMSYNILAQDLMQQSSELYLHCHPDILSWNYRFANLMQEFQHWDPDILCLQEVQEDHYWEQLEPSLRMMGFTCFYKRRTGCKTDGCAVCYKPTRFRLLCASPVEYLRPGLELLNRDNVGLVLLLQPLVPEGLGQVSVAPLCVANTHVLYNPRRGDVKLAQMAILLAEVDKVARLSDGSHCPIILCGDLNSVPDSPLYNFIRDGELQYHGMPAWKVSGQEDFSHQLYQRKLQAPLWPSSLGITDCCQYITSCHPKRSERLKYGRDFLLRFRFCDVACQRPAGLVLMEGVTDSKPERPAGWAEPVLEEDTVEPEPVLPRTIGTIQHCLHLTSVYTHFLPQHGRPEVTTMPLGFGMTVDYIFFSAESCDNGNRADRRLYQDGTLKLLGRLSLLSEEILWAANGLPNPFCSSDHLCLLASFGMKVTSP
ncbi:protein angel homolog 1 isoform X1 [Suricata suricatta]|uniref:Protein angel homolog 1 n=1 Tax=Suricata suricatta TaxID=37032 RepID=A0A673TAT1_SURSU|nr:protein angel homolog 1 isoform X1 [Suricata suricatta]XP_029807793.1 protein angel homolog 1 isoform X1 [Suricata suricatta]